MGKNVSQLSASIMKAPSDSGQDEGAKKPRLSEDSQAMIGLKLRELYDDVVSEPVPDRFLELLGKLGDNDDSSK